MNRGKQKVTDIVNLKSKVSKPRYLILHDLEEGLAHFKFCKDNTDVEKSLMVWLKKEYDINDMKIIAIGNVKIPKLKINA